MSYNKQLHKEWRNGRDHWLNRQKQKHIFKGLAFVLIPIAFVLVIAFGIAGAISQEKLQRRALSHANQNATLLVQDVALDDNGNMFVLADRHGMAWSVEVMCDPEGCDFAGWTPTDAAYRYAADQEFLRAESMNDDSLFDDDF